MELQIKAFTNFKTQLNTASRLSFGLRGDNGVLAEKLARTVYKGLKQESKNLFTLEAKVVVSTRKETSVLKVEISLVKKMTLPQLLSAAFFIPTRGFKVFRSFNQAEIGGCIKKVVEDYLNNLNSQALSHLAV